jgi:hypothetical protein
MRISALVLGAICLASLSSAGLAAPLPNPPRLIAEMRLPTGPLQLVGHNPSVVFFIDRANLRRTGAIVIVRVYRVFSPSFAGFGESLQSVSDWSVDCARMMRSSLGEQIFGERGNFKFWNEPEPPTSLAVGGAPATVAKVACDLAEAPAIPPVMGGPALILFSQALLGAPVTSPGDPAVGLRALSGPSQADFAAVAPVTLPSNSEPPSVKLICVGGVQGTLKACAVSNEAPTGLGFGQAALSLTSKIRVASFDPAQSTDGAVFPFVINFPKPD